MFFCCHHCNSTKLVKFENILNCTDLDDDIEKKLKYYCKTFPNTDNQVIIEALDSDEKVINTKLLLLAVFLGTENPNKINESINLRKYLIKEMKKFEDDVIAYYEIIECDESHFKSDKDTLLRRIKIHLSASSPFTSFKRQIIKDNSKLYQEFGQYLTEPL